MSKYEKSKNIQNPRTVAQNQKHQILKAGHFIQEDIGLGLAEIIITFIRNNTSLKTKALKDEQEG